jgi:nitrite reductase/ring-hydroxylating ferredoxin subunit
LCGKTVTCPWHGWQYDVTTGKQELSETIRQPSLAVKVEDGGVFVDLEGAS